MKELIIYIGQSSICIGIFYLIYRIFLRSATSFSFNRAFLLIGLVASFIIPSIHFSYEVSLPISISSVTEPATIETTTETTDISIWLLLSGVYVIGIVIQLLRNITSYRRLIRLIRSGKITRTDHYKIIDSPQIKSPFTVLNCIAINTKNMTDIEKDVILKHETTHISQKHWIDLLCSECALLLQWFNPLMWLYVSSQKENHEFLADKAVIDAGISPAIYQAALINQRFQGPVFSFSNSFNYPNQLNRLFMIKKAKTSPWRRIAALALIPSFGLFFWASATPRYIFKSVDESSSNQLTEALQDSVHVIGFAANSNSPLQVIGYTTDSTTKNTDPDKALYIIDDKESSLTVMKNIDPKNIESVSILKDKAATELYGDKGKNGVIIITTKKETTTTPFMIRVNEPLSSTNQQEGSNLIIQVNPNNQSETSSAVSANEDQNGLSVMSSKKEEEFKLTNIRASNPLIIIDGKVESDEILKTINPNRIERIEILKDDKATALYGTRGKGGVVMVTLKK